MVEAPRQLAHLEGNNEELEVQGDAKRYVAHPANWDITGIDQFRLFSYAKKSPQGAVEKKFVWKFNVSEIQHILIAKSHLDAAYIHR